MAAVIGLDLGATNLRAATVDSGGRCGAVHRAPVPHGDGAGALADAAASVVLEASQGEEPATVGVGLAGWLDAAGEVIRVGPNLGLRSTPFAALLRERLGAAQVLLVNDLRAIAWGEYLYGAGREAKMLLVVFFGSGVGSSVVSHGRPLAGSSNMACEIGHVRVVPDGGRACGCGQLGCLEAYAGGHNLERRARHDVEAGTITSLLDLAKGRPEAITGATIEAAAAAGDEYAMTLFREAAAYGAQVLGSLITYLNPDRLVIGGGLWSGCPTLQSLLRERLKRATSPEAFRSCSLVDPELGDKAGIVGAAAFARARAELAALG